MSIASQTAGRSTLCRVPVRVPVLWSTLEYFTHVHVYTVYSGTYTCTGTVHVCSSPVSSQRVVDMYVCTCIYGYIRYFNMAIPVPVLEYTGTPVLRVRTLVHVQYNSSLDRSTRVPILEYNVAIPVLQ